MHHRRPANGDVFDLRDLAFGGYTLIAQVGLHCGVAEGEQFSGDGVHFRMRGERAVESTLEIGHAHGVQIAVEHIRKMAFLKRENLAGLAECMGIRL